MRYLVTGAGQIGRQLVTDLTATGHDAVVLRRSADPVPGATTVSADVLDAAALARAAEGCAAIFHCVHAPYRATVWAAELPQREAAVLDRAHALGIPVVFPESLYAFGHAAEHLAEGTAPAPVEGKGRVRADLLRARAEHPATALSVVASDLIGPTATAAGAVAVATVIKPAAAGKRCVVWADPDQPHSLTHIPDLSRAMIAAAQRAAELAPSGSAVLNAPTDAPHTLRELAAAVAAGRPRVMSVPAWVVKAAGVSSALVRELADVDYLWRRPTILEPGVLTTRLGLAPTPWAEAVAETAARFR